MNDAVTGRRGHQMLAIAQKLLPNTPLLPIGEYALNVAEPSWQYHLREFDQAHRTRTFYLTMIN